MTIFLLTFPLLALLSILATIRIVKLRQIFLQHRLASVSSASDIDAIGCIGISILCSDPVNISVVVGLLATRYPLSEVVVVIDSASHPDLLAQLILRYSLRLNCEHAHNTFRSTQLCYRRLVVIDHKSCNNDIRADIAAQHASHNYLLRVSSDCGLFPYAAGRFVQTIASIPTGRVDAITTSEKNTLLISRALWIDKGSFKDIDKHLTGCFTLHLCEPLEFTPILGKEHYELIERSGYNFSDFLALNIMKSANKLLSLRK